MGVFGKRPTGTIIEKYDKIVKEFGEKYPDGNVPTQESSNLHSDINSMLFASMQVYSFSSLRKRAANMDLKNEHLILPQRTSKLSNDERNEEFSQPTDAQITAKAIGEFVYSNLDVLDESGNINNDLFVQSLLALSKLKDAHMVRFDGDFKGKAFTYGFLINHDDKRITIVFRGTTNRSEWKANIQFAKGNINTPPMLTELGFDKDTKTIPIHSGFKKFFFYKAGPSKGQKYNQIKECLLKLYENEKYKDYELYVTGHSLGGALSTIMTFELATSRKLAAVRGNKPVVNISFASPHVGGKTWCKAFQTLEKAGKIRHIRVSSMNDIVSSLPPTPNFGHVGVNLFLNPDSKNKYEISNVGHRSLFGQLSFRAMTNHRLESYFEKNNEIKDEISGMTMESIYAEPRKNPLEPSL